MPSALFDIKNPSSFGLSPEAARGCALQAFGKNTTASDAAWKDRIDSLCQLPTDDLSCKEWSSALAREWLLRSWIDNGCPPSPKLLANIPLFPDEASDHLRLSNLEEKKGAATMIPLDSEPPAVAALYAIQSTKKTADSQRSIQHKGVCFHVYLVPSIPGLEIHGESWQLAAHICAHMALNGAKDSLSHLACDWSATGRITDRRITRVTVGSKFDQQASLRDRKILVPHDNLADLQSYTIDPTMRERIRTVKILDEAIAAVEGTAPKKGDIAIPSPLPVMHALVGGSWQAALTPILLTRPQKLVLWHSDLPASQDCAKAIKAALTNGLGKALAIDASPEVREISSDHLSTAWNQLHQADLATGLESGEPLVFNITSGNRIMAMAVFPWAQRYPSLSLVYRDIDAKPFELTTLRFDGLTPVHDTYRPTWVDNPPTLIDWNALWSKNWNRAKPAPKISGEEILKILCFSPESPSDPA